MTISGRLSAIATSTARPLDGVEATREAPRQASADRDPEEERDEDRRVDRVVTADDV